MSAVSVRSARADDAEEMAAVYVAAAQKAWAHIYGAANLETLGAPVENFREQIRSDDSRQEVLVAEREGRVVAFAVIRSSEDDDADANAVGELDTFYSDPSVWGLGVGRELMTAALEALNRVGFSSATLWTAEDNHRPRRIYERAGWAADGKTRERVWRGVSFRELRYRIRLQP